MGFFPKEYVFIVQMFVEDGRWNNNNNNNNNNNFETMKNNIKQEIYMEFKHLYIFF